MEEEIRVVIATTTYNMADTLERTYRSILEQSYHNFYWLIIDNGSEDNTEEKVRIFQNEKRIEICYCKKKHGIRATAINVMLDKIEGDLCVEVHADDELTKDALRIFVEEYLRIPGEEKAKYWCIVTHCRKDDSSEIIGKRFPESINDNQKRSYRYAFHTVGEKHYAMVVNIVKTKRFDLNISDKVTYLQENILWYQFQEEYLSWFTNKVTRIYYDDAKNRYSLKQATKQMRYNSYYSQKAILNKRSSVKLLPLSELIRICIFYTYNGQYLGFSSKKCRNELRFKREKLFCAFSYVPILIYRMAKGRL